MEMPISRASAYLKRNSTTHSWYADWSTAGSIMSRSCPSARTLEEHMRNARAAMSVSASFYQPRGSSASDSVPAVVKARSYRKASSNRVPTSSASSPGQTTSVRVPGDSKGAGPMDKGKPSCAYSYDGGFFVTANNANKDFFVINPEWVSEVETIKKLPEKEVERRPPKPISWRSYKRSKSAPPSKFHNPITWQN